MHFGPFFQQSTWNMVRLLLGLLFVLVLWSRPGLCQELEDLVQKLSKKQLHQAALKDNPEVLEEVVSATMELRKLWTDYFPEMLDNNISVSPQCQKSAMAVLHNHNRSNATLPEIVPLLDATGKQGAGILGGNFIMDGAFDECFEYNYTSFCMGNAELSFLPPTPIGEYLWTISLCVPKGCGPSDVASVMNWTKVFKVNETLMSCSNRKQPAYSAGAIVMIVVCAVFIIMVLLGTLVDRLVMTTLDTKHKRILAINDAGVTKISEKTPLLTHTAVKSTTRCNVKLADFLTAFSLYKTIPTLLATKQAPSVITSLNGIRVVSMFWVILGHTYIWIMRKDLDNPLKLIEVSSRFTFQPVGNSFLAVDSFFFLSAVLVAYLTFRQMKKTGRFPWIHYYAHRYLRLTPVYAFVIFFAWFLTDHIVASQAFSFANPFAEKCSQYWWTNLLYINNLHPWKFADQCVSWTWYLANDMQFFIIAPVILVPMYYYLPVGLIVAGVVLVASLVTTGTLAGVFDFQADLFASEFGYHFVPKTNLTYIDVIYEKPWARISPYVVGILLGYVFFKGVRIPFRRPLNVPVYVTMWVCSGLLLFVTCYGLYPTWHGHIPTMAENVLYITFSKFAWAIGLALLVFACHSGYGGFINMLLSLKIWTPLSRLTYNAYLVHPIVLTVVYDQLQKTLHYTDITAACFAVAFVMLSYSIAAVLCVFVEFPLGSVEMLLFKLVGLGGRETQRQGTALMSDDGRGQGVIQGKA